MRKRVEEELEKCKQKKEMLLKEKEGVVANAESAGEARRREREENIERLEKKLADLTAAYEDANTKFHRARDDEQKYVILAAHHTVPLIVMLAVVVISLSLSLSLCLSVCLSPLATIVARPWYYSSAY